MRREEKGGGGGGEGRRRGSAVPRNSDIYIDSLNFSPLFS